MMRKDQEVCNRPQMPSASTSHSCPLCFQDRVACYHQDRKRSYYRCFKCHLVYVPQEEHIGPDEEKARYDRHNNKVYDPGYRRFLSRLLGPLRQQIPPPALGLDFGCGPGPALAAMAREAGYTMAVFDPFYAPDPEVWNTSYDFITCTEVVEHLRQPGITLPWIWTFVRPGGLLAIMTKLVHSRSAFAQWHYIRDETHVSFFSPATFDWLAGTLQAGLSFDGRDVIFLHKTD